MSVTTEMIAEAALTLPREDRAFLARELIASLDDAADPDVETAWRDEIDWRTREMKNGRVSVKPIETVLAEIRAKLRTGLILQS
jgi:putative addiction module component (TIGR02574 family)